MFWLLVTESHLFFLILCLTGSGQANSTVITREKKIAQSVRKKKYYTTFEGLMFGMISIVSLMIRLRGST
jgi:hypothetical protein